MKLYTSDTRQNAKTVIFPRAVDVLSLQDLLNAAQQDHIFSQMRGNYRNAENFLQTDCLVLDLDNTHSEDPDDWKSINDIADAFPDVHFYYVRSRNYMKPKIKDGRAQEPREKYHLYFPLAKPITKRSGAKKALDAAGTVADYVYGTEGLLDQSAAKPEQPMYGVEDPQGGEIEGGLCLDEYLLRPEVLALWKQDPVATYEQAQARGLDWIDEAEQRRAVVWLEEWAQKHSVELGARYTINTGDHKGAVAYPVHCPWEGDHTEYGGPLESVVIVDCTGKLNYLCRHAHCVSHTWAAYRRRVEELADFSRTESTTEVTPQIALEEYTQRAAGAFVARFWTDAENRTPAIKTGFRQLDEFLDGGLYPGLYVLGAVSSLGKTTYALQLADQIATEGTDVLFFSLEMSRAELMAKSISRLTAILAARSAGKTIAEATEAQELPNAKTARALTDPARFMHFNGEEQALIRQAAALYQVYGARIWIDEGPARRGISAEYVRKAVEQHIAITGRRPVIFLDYLQIMESPDNRLTDKQKTDQNVRELRDIGRRNNCPVVVISSLNRENYSAPMNMAAFKESGAIEYSSDVLIGLQPIGMDEGGTAAAAANNAALVDKTKILPVRSVELKILKQRGGVTGRRIAYKYAAAFNVFEEDGESLERVNTRGKKSRKAQEAAERRASIPDTLDKILGELQNITGNPFLTEKEDLDDF